MEQVKENEKTKQEYDDLKESYKKLYDSLYECETMLREFGELCWHLEKIMPTLEKFKKIGKNYKYQVTYDETIVPGPPDSLCSFGNWKDDW